MLSAALKLADRTFIIGHLLPTAIFLLLLLYLFRDVPSAVGIIDIVTGEHSFENVIYLTILVYGLSIVVAILNRTLIQTAEGYLWPVSMTKNTLESGELRRFKQKLERFDNLSQEWETCRENFPPAIRREYEKLRIELVMQFPSKEYLILPTRFGNAVRAFEDYPRQVYGADPIPLWIHLNTVISKDFQASVEDARTSVNFLLNMLFFSIVLFVISLARSIIGLGLIVFAGEKPLHEIIQLLTSDTLAFWLFALFAGLAAWVMYQFAVERVYDWGVLVKAAFDCYLPDLAKKLGYKLPLTDDEQRKFWIAVSQRAIFHLPLKPQNWPRADNAEREHGGSETAEINLGEEPDETTDGEERAKA